MLIMKSRSESIELRILRSLNARMNLPAKDKNHFDYLKNGFEGELMFDEWMTDKAHNGLILNDLLLETNRSLYQIDSLYISSNKIFLLEVKNYEGDYVMEGDQWFSSSKLEIKNPIHQLKRSELLFRRLLHEHHFSFSVAAYLVFINPEFQLYQTPLNLPIIFPSQLNRFADTLEKKSNPLKESHSALAHKLLSLHQDDSPYSRLPNYSYDQLNKGILCPKCYSFYTSLTKMRLICKNCKGLEGQQSAVLRSIEEFKILFPKSSITTNQIYDWCSVIDSKKSIWRILSQKFNKEGHGKAANYGELL
ncbi:nuclease-related domain-containing protein [Peribacillus frigoritolerans]|uniref:nuclease-related domain-containing protein n=1 Tax=Peribacillus frigoritolerans TaxID=450367 RepID=UPI0025700A5B|nr:nuclease-related domain-containing protein [Peribacillus frigoritolerans]